jgi:hypothetical protein
VSCYTKLTLIEQPFGDEPRQNDHVRTTISLRYCRGKAKLKVRFSSRVQVFCRSLLDDLSSFVAALQARDKDLQQQ